MKTTTVEPVAEEPVIQESVTPPTLPAPAPAPAPTALPATPTGTTQRGPDRFLVGIIGGVVALLALAGIVIALLHQPVRQLPADSPGGTIQRFYTAIEQKNYDEAYNLLSDSMVNKPTRDVFVNNQMTSGSYSYSSARRARIDKENVYGDKATISVAVTHFYGSAGPFGGSSEYTDTEMFSLQREGGTWRITELPWPYGYY
jgi:hypothetical protein